MAPVRDYPADPGKLSSAIGSHHAGAFTAQSTKSVDSSAGLKQARLRAIQRCLYDYRVSCGSSCGRAEGTSRCSDLYAATRAAKGETAALPFQDLRKSARALARDLVYAAGRLPVVGDVLVDAQTRRFNANSSDVARLFNGVYVDFAAAERAIPKDRNAGYDNERSASRGLNEWLAIAPSDYPVLFWLSRLLPDATYLFDWGGNVGLKYFAYRTYLAYASSLTWCVSDVPAVVAAGKAIAEKEDARGLVFSTTLDELSRADILLADGVLHFIEDPLGMLRRAPRLPEHVLLSKVPAYDSADTVTLQNMGTAFCPNHLFNRSRFVDNFIALGYRLVDEWRAPELGCIIPFHPERSIAGYSGFYFIKAA